MNQPHFPLPTSWASLTVAQYLALATPGAVSLAAVLPDLSPDLLAGLSPNQQQLLAARVLASLDEQALGELLPTPGLLEVGRAAYGLYVLAQRYINSLPDAHPLAHGAYLYALYREPTGHAPAAEQVAAAHAAVLARPVGEVYADCLFFLAGFYRVGTGQPAQGAAQPGTLRIQLPTPAAVDWWARLSRRLRPAA